jgi:hypothetical protein
MTAIGQGARVFCILLLLASLSPAWGNVEIFGAMPKLDASVSTISMIIIIASVILLEKGFHRLHDLTSDTPFETMIHSIEKELMIVGTMAFIFKLILNITHIDSMWVLGLEFADLLVPIISFLVCTICVVLIIVSMRIMKSWIKAYHLHLYEILEEFYLSTHNRWNSGNMSWLPLLTINSQMEFRIMNAIFCENYNISKDAFAFDEYVYHTFEKLLLTIMRMELRDWAFVVGIVVLDYVRNVLGLDMHNCVREHASTRRALSGGGMSIDSEYASGCLTVSSLENYTISGWVLFLFCLFMAVISRVYEIRLMATRGIENAEDYALFLTSYEDAHLEDIEEGKDRGKMHNYSNHKLNAEDLKRAIEKAKTASGGSTEGHGSHGKYSPDHGHESKSAIVCHFLHVFLFGPLRALFCQANEAPVAPVISQADLDFNDRVSQDAMLRRKEKQQIAEKALAGQERRSTVAALVINGAGKLLRRVKLNRQTRMAEIDELLDESTGLLKAREDFSHIYLFNSPHAYFFVVEMLIMPIALFFGLWITNYAKIASKGYTFHFEFIDVIPGLFCIAFYAYTVKCAALLRAVTSINNDAMQEIIEHSEETRMLGENMRKLMLDKLHTMGDPELQLKALFDEIDDNGSNLLSRREFQIFLEALGITFSRRKWSAIFVQIDLNNDDEISFKELFLFLFPDNDVAKKEELRRLKIKGMHAKAAAEAAAAIVTARKGKKGKSEKLLATIHSSRMFSNLELDVAETQSATAGGAAAAEASSLHV